jgi:2-polyprenyl-3-methyl-5-hydroxy-6-metoxy-1,4-benzoquinol methylase
MTENSTDIQNIQEVEYEFPYHYISQFREGFNQTYNWTWGLYHASALEFLLDRIKAYDFDSAADIGCGDGRFTRELSIDFPGKRIVGIDYSEKAIQMAKAMNPGLQFTKMDIIKDQLDESFDLITLIEVLEHIPLDSVRNFMEALGRMLKPDGVLVMTVPHINKPLEAKHFQHFTLESIQPLFSGIFEIKAVSYFEKTSIVSKVLNKILTNPFYILNQKSIKNAIYSFYKKRLFPANENNCARFLVELKKLKGSQI